MVTYLACDTFMENHLTTLDSTVFLQLMPENQGHSGRLTVYVQTLWCTKRVKKHRSGRPLGVRLF